MKIKILIAAGLMSAASECIAQNSVGIGTSSSNPNAVLELVSPTNNQGFLVPRVTSEQRVAMSANLSENENGLLLYDSEANQIFFWENPSWNAVGSGSGGSINTGFEVVNGNLQISDGNGSLTLPISDIENHLTDVDVTNELQNLTLDGTELKITDGTGVDLAPLIPPGGSDDQKLIINGDLLEIESGDGTQVNLASYIDDADASITNEIQDLSFNSKIISLSNDPDNTSIDLSNYDDDVDDDFSGSYDDLTDVPSDIADGDDVDDADASTTNELITNASLETGSILRITDAGGNHDVDLSSLDNSSPWLTNGNDISYSLGNVGIGTTTATSELNIHSTDGLSAINLSTQNTNDNSELFLGEDALGNYGMKLRYNGSDNTFKILGYSTGDIGPHFEIGRSGNVRINTTFATPSNGSTNITGTFQNLSSPTRRFVKITASLTGRGIRTILGGEDGEEVILAHVGGNPIIIRNRATTTNGFLALKDHINFTMYQNDTLHLIFDSTFNAWLEVGRGDNHGIIID